jgi:tricorn protease
MHPVWSPDSRWVTYPKLLENHFKAAFAYNAETNEKIQLTDGLADVITPVWDQSGDYIYILASTDYGLSSGWLDMSSYDPDVSRSLYCVLLNSDSKLPTAIKSDEEDSEPEKKEESSESTKKSKSKKNKEEEKTKEDKSIKIDANGITNRVVALPLPARNYTGLMQAPKGFVFISESVANESGSKIHKYDINKLEAKDYTSGISTIRTSFNGDHVLFRKGNTWSLTGAGSAPKGNEDALKINIRMKVDPQAEYHQILKEGWRYMRDFLYVDNVHGAPWEEVYEWYAPWIEHVRHRTDLNYVVDILSGEVT